MGICPVAGIEKYIDVATTGYLFRPTTPKGGIANSPLKSSTAEARLKGYLKEMRMDEGETLHGFRSGCAITLALSEADVSEIMDHVGWTRRHTALYYMQLAKVLNPTGASAKLAAHEGSAVAAWEDVNELKRFVCACPTDNLLKKGSPE